MPATVEVHLFAAARAAVGHSVLEVGPGGLADILGRLEADYPDFSAVRPRCSFLLDGTAVHDEGVPVGAGSRVDVLPPFSGG
ncbi:MAG: MoaD/ThiS family protein [Actinomycetota bacterium]|nr:MoaD/ThiS family protein [Actinomycetota bacterium]MDP1878104.1 MoaD/ThiS family protein [Actinomycetota bacterium]